MYLKRNRWLLVLCILVITATTIVTTTIGAATPTPTPGSGATQTLYIVANLYDQAGKYIGFYDVSNRLYELIDFSPSGTRNVDQLIYNTGTVVTLRAKNTSTAVFKNWVGNMLGTSPNTQNPLMVTMDSSKQGAAIYEVITTPTPRRGSTLTPTPTRRVVPTVTRRITPTSTRRMVNLTPTVRPANGISISFIVSSDWGSGYTCSITIQNNTSTLIPAGWTLSWDFIGDQQITNLWNGALTQIGPSVVVTGTMPIGANGGTVNLGFNASGTSRGWTNVKFNGVPVGGV